MKRNNNRSVIHAVIMLMTASLMALSSNAIAQSSCTNSGTYLWDKYEVLKGGTKQVTGYLTCMSLGNTVFNRVSNSGGTYYNFGQCIGNGKSSVTWNSPSFGSNTWPKQKPALQDTSCDMQLGVAIVSSVKATAKGTFTLACGSDPTYDIGDTDAECSFTCMYQTSY